LQVPENCAFVEEIPKTTVGKFDKKPVRARLRAVELTVQRLVRESQG
jgi:fatty-acyl-CoA synthase